MLSWLGIPALVVSGEGVQRPGGPFLPHAWNIVEIDGKCHHLDVTFLLGANSGKPYVYPFFNQSDEEALPYHRWDRSLLPSCTAWKGEVGGLLVIDSLYGLRKAVEEAVKKGENTLAFKSKIPAEGNSFKASSREP